jgi:hypothetical protein
MQPATTWAPKPCVSCGRTITWRKKWERNWEEIKYCSDACRRRRITSVDTELEAAILRLLDQRPASASICPSEAARQLAPQDDTWRALMEPARAAARRLMNNGAVEITQKGKVVDPSTAKGPIRIRLKRS